MKKSFYLLMAVSMVVAIFLGGLTGCAKKQVTKESSEQPQAMTKQEPAEVKQEEQKPALAPPEEAAKPAAEGEQKIAPAEEAKQLEDIYFDFDKYELRPEDRKILDDHAAWLSKNTDTQIRIEGNCDERGTAEYNMALGQRRASEAMNYLVNMGIGKERISTVSYGKERPLDPGHNEEAWAKNRRDHFILQKK
jgi:peptidoglycan-associated lipoprotein